MSDKAKRVAEQFPDIVLKWYATPGVAMYGEWKARAVLEIAAILDEEFPGGDGDIAKLKAKIVLLRQAEGRPGL